MGAPKGKSSWNKGISPPKEVREKMRLAKLGKKHSIEHNIKIGKSGLGRVVTEETRNKIRIAQSGEKAHNWIRDRTKLKKSRIKSYDTEYKIWMLKVKNRDSWKCRLENKDCYGRMEAHHIFNWQDYPELRYLENNGITICHFHHPKGKKAEERMIPIFQEIIK